MSQAVLAILTLYLNNNQMLEEKVVYQKMITEGKKMGLDVFVFTPADVNDSKQSIHALEYDPDNRKWSKRWRSFPHLIYDRCRIQNSPRFQQLLQFRKKYNHLTFLNRPLRNKWTIYQVLRENEKIRPHLPHTLLYNNLSDVNKMLSSHSSIYLKPINGTGGRGIMRIDKLSNPRSTYYVQGRDQDRKIISPRKVHSSNLAPLLQNWNMKQRYLVQESIPIRLPNGRIHDYRMLVQKNGEGEWELTGIAGRMGGAKSVTSNLHGGGAAVAMDTLLSQWITSEQKQQQIKNKAERIGIETASYLETKYGALCELALDLAINKNGDIYLLEVNPKPAREVFSKIGEQGVYHKSLVRPLQYALWLHRKKTQLPEEKKLLSE